MKRVALLSKFLNKLCSCAKTSRHEKPRGASLVSRVPFSGLLEIEWVGIARVVVQGDSDKLIAFKDVAEYLPHSPYIVIEMKPFDDVATLFAYTRMVSDYLETSTSNHGGFNYLHGIVVSYGQHHAVGHLNTV